MRDTGVPLVDHVVTGGTAAAHMDNGTFDDALGWSAATVLMWIDTELVYRRAGAGNSYDVISLSC